MNDSRRISLSAALGSLALLLSSPALCSFGSPPLGPDAAVAVLEADADRHLRSVSPPDKTLWRAIATRSDRFEAAAARAKNGINRMALEIAGFSEDDGPLISAPMPEAEPDASKICVLALSASGYEPFRGWLQTALAPSGGGEREGLEISAYHEAAHCAAAWIEADYLKSSLSAAALEAIGPVGSQESAILWELSEETFADIYAIVSYEAARGLPPGSIEPLWEGLAQLRAGQPSDGHRTFAILGWAFQEIRSAGFSAEANADPHFRLQLALSLRDQAFEIAGASPAQRP